MIINKLKIMICAEYSYGTYWLVMKKPILIIINNIQVPCFSLESERRAYDKLGMSAKARFIDKFLTN